MESIHDRNPIEHLSLEKRSEIRRNRIRRQIQTQIADIFLDAWRDKEEIEDTIEEVKAYLDSILKLQWKKSIEPTSTESENTTDTDWSVWYQNRLSSERDEQLHLFI